MKETYLIIKDYLFNGVYGYALFGLYALTISPFVTQFFDYGEKNVFIAIFGFVMLIAEFFALNFKLTMVRLRAEEKRIAYKKETGIDIIPSISRVVLFGFFMRLVFQVAVIMVSMTALGYACTEKEMSPQGVTVLMIGLFAEMCGLIYIYLKSDIYSDPPQNKKQWREELKEGDDWYKANLPLASSIKHFRMELLSDLILHVYALMLFTSFWEYINQVGIQLLRVARFGQESTLIAAVKLFPMLFSIVMLGLMPMRIAYWIEDSMHATTKKEKIRTWIVFFIVAAFTCAPAILKFVALFLLHLPDTFEQTSSALVRTVLSLSLFLLLLLVQLTLFNSKKSKIK